MTRNIELLQTAFELQAMPLNARLALTSTRGDPAATLQTLACKRGELQGMQVLSPSLYQGEARGEFVRTFEESIKSGVRWALPGDDDYPAALSDIVDPPWIIFYRGEMPPQLRVRSVHGLASVAIVGARDCDREGAVIAHRLARDAAARGICVVSGLALGIDTAAHSGALDAGRHGTTVAFLGGGIDSIYPASNRDLAARIVSAGGAVASHFRPAQPSLPHQFLDRNRLIAGAARLTIVVQASARSGALVTARLAAEHGREVGAVPGSPCNKRSQGTNRLLKEGAHLIEGIDDILELFPEVHADRNAPTGETVDRSSLSSQARELLDTLQEADEPIPLSELDPQGSAAAALLELEIAGIVTAVPGSRIALTHERQ